ncbi:T-cell surface glycoprotein CD8 alpha chain [Sorex araneus]|uniref:T-cell surface glycoprotein CD8 alpha chain n=1 Tax=Sorex araneus TaxID=42254 RepID=UPI00243367CF|nr:T-cell surface glycoprotein CD8 alpha chain [Sorex araneus]
MAQPVPALLLPLALLLHARATYQEPSVFGLPTRHKQTSLGGTVDLECQVLRSDTSGGCTWFFQRPNSNVAPTFLAYISTHSSNVHRSDKIKNISARKDNNKFILTLQSVQAEQQGYYFCMVLISSVTHFSPFIEVQLPEKKTTTTPAPIPPTSAPTVPPQPPSARPDTCVPTVTRARRKGGLDFSCDIYIWAPLSGVCVVLLLSLVTVLACCRRNQRRVCKCPRPHVRLGGKPSPSERSV